MKFLFVHEVNWREKPIYEIHDIPELLSLAGHEVTFIDFPESLKADPKNTLLSFRSNKFFRQSRAHVGSNIDVFTPGRVISGPFQRYFASLTFVPLFWRTVRERRIDVIILYGVPTNGWQTIFLAKILKVPVLFRAIDIAHLLRETKFRFLVKIAERYIYRNAAHISTHNEALKDYCISLGASSQKLSTDPPSLDLARFSASPRDNDLAQSYGIKANQKIVFFRGTLYRFAGLEKFIELFSEHLHMNPNVCVLIVGNGEAEESIKATISKCGLTKQVILKPFVEYDHLVKNICLADVSVNTFEPSLVTHCVLPGRVLQSMACAVPVVSTPLKGMMSYSSGSDAVLYRDLDDSFVRAVVDLLNDDVERKRLGNAGREVIMSNGTWQEFIHNFSDLAENLVQTK